MASLAFVEIDAATKQFRVTDESRDFLMSLGDKPLAVVAIAGPYRNGKSTLLNRVVLELPPGEGFDVSQTVNACTKGLHISRKLLPSASSSSGAGASILVMDTEGFGATTSDRTHDTNIFALALLLSSLFMYNSRDAINQNALNDLGLVTQISKHLRMTSAAPSSSSSSSSAQGAKRRRATADDAANEDELRKIFPAFVYVLRDFTLTFKDADNDKVITARQFLESALQHVPDGDEAKNDVRQTLRTMFETRDCFAMTQPSADPEVLRNLNAHAMSELSPEFQQQAAELRALIQRYARPKCIDPASRTCLTGPSLVLLAEQYCKAFNEKRTPVVRDVWRYISLEQCQVALKAALATFAELTAPQHADTWDSRRKLDAGVKAAFDAATRTFQQQAIGDSTAAFEQLRTEVNARAADMRKALTVRFAEAAAALLDGRPAQLAKDADAGTASAMQDIVAAVAAAQLAFTAQCGKDADAQAAWDHECCVRLQVWLPQIHDRLQKAASADLERACAERARHTHTIEVLEAQVQELASTADALAAAAAELETARPLAAETLALRVRVAELEPLAVQAEELRGAYAEAAQAQAQMTAMQTQLMRAEDTVTQRDADLAVTRQQLSEANASLAQAQTAHTSQIADLERHTCATLAQLREHKDQAVRRAAQAAQELEVTKTSLAAAVADAAKAQTRHARELQDQLAAQAQTHKLALQAKETEKSNLVTKWQEDLAQFKAESVAARDKQAHENQQALSQLARERAALERQMQQTALELTSVKAQCDARTAELAQARRELKDARTEQARLANELASTSTRASLREESNASLSAQNAQMRSEMGRMSDELRVIHAAHQADLLQLKLHHAQELSRLQDADN